MGDSPSYANLTMTKSRHTKIVRHYYDIYFIITLQFPSDNVPQIILLILLDLFSLRWAFLRALKRFPSKVPVKLNVFGSKCLTTTTAFRYYYHHIRCFATWYYPTRDALLRNHFRHDRVISRSCPTAWILVFLTLQITILDFLLLGFLGDHTCTGVIWLFLNWK